MYLETVARLERCATEARRVAMGAAMLAQRAVDDGSRARWAHAAHAAWVRANQFDARVNRAANGGAVCD